MKSLLILNDPPYGTERSYNGLRLARARSKQPGHEARLFLMGDAIACAKAGQNVPQGYYNAADMVKMVGAAGQVGLCGTCMDARGVTEAELVPGVERRSLSDLAAWTAEADKILAF
jgi:uncharacterized protein involved in oxidation of intracellular sulfur